MKYKQWWLENLFESLNWLLAGVYCMSHKGNSIPLHQHLIYGYQHCSDTHTVFFPLFLFIAYYLFIWLMSRTLEFNPLSFFSPHPVSLSLLYFLYVNSWWHGSIISTSHLSVCPVTSLSGKYVVCCQMVIRPKTSSANCVYHFRSDVVHYYSNMVIYILCLYYILNVNILCVSWCRQWGSCPFNKLMQVPLP